MARKSKEQTLMVGVLGTGEVTGKPGIEALVAQFVEANGPVIFVVPFSDEFFTESVATVADWALEEGIPVRGVVHPSYELEESWLKDLDGPPHETALVRKELEKILTDADDAALIVLWDDNDSETQAACLRLNQEGIPLYEMSSGLAEIEGLVLDTGETDETDVEDDVDTPDSTTKKEPTVAAEETEEFQPYTREELEEIAENDRDELKTIAAEDFDIEVAPRTRTNTIIDAILAAQEEELGGDETAEDDGEAEEAAAETAAPAGDLNDEVVELIVSAVVDETSDLIKDLIAPVMTELEALQASVESIRESTKDKGTKSDGGSSSERPARRRRR